jgi:hypothetical protein
MLRFPPAVPQTAWYGTSAFPPFRVISLVEMDWFSLCRVRAH